MLETVQAWKRDLDSQKDSVESEHMELTLERGRLESCIEELNRDLDEAAGDERSLKRRIEACKGPSINDVG